MKREDDRAAEIRWMLCLREKAILVCGTDGGDADGWGHLGHGYGLRLKGNSVAFCFEIEFLNYGFGLSDLPLHEVITQIRVINSGLKVMLIVSAHCE